VPIPQGLRTAGAAALLIAVLAGCSQASDVRTPVSSPVVDQTVPERNTDTTVQEAMGEVTAVPPPPTFAILCPESGTVAEGLDRY
jgi:hypothetical protein